MKKTILIIIAILSAVSQIQAQPRDRLADLYVDCYRKASVGIDGSLWLCTACGYLYRADNIHSPWRTVVKPKEDDWNHITFEDVAAFNRNVAIAVGYHLWDKVLRITGSLWNDTVPTGSKRPGGEWFHPAWCDKEGHVWAGSQDGLLTFSADSGRTFIALRDTAFERKQGIDDIYMLSADSGWIAGHGNRIYTTSDNWRTVRRWPTPLDQKLYVVTDPHDQYWVNRVRTWKGYLIVDEAFMSFYTPLGDTLRWQHTPQPITDFEVDTATGALWALDDSGYVVRFEDFDRWQRYPLRVQRQARDKLQIAGIHDSKAYWLTDIGVVAIAADGHMDTCAFLTDERPIEEPHHTLAHGTRLWGSDGVSIYLLDAQGWYRVCRSKWVKSLSPDPDREDRVIFLDEENHIFSVDTAGRVVPYTYRQPLGAFVKEGLRSLEIRTYSVSDYHHDEHLIRYTRRGDRLEETFNNVDSTLHTTRSQSVAAVEQALLDVGARYNLFPTPKDFGLDDSTLDLHEVWEPNGWSSSASIGYAVTLINQAGDTLMAFGATDVLYPETRFPWLLPMKMAWRKAVFETYQPALMQVLQPMMPDSMMMRHYLDNSTLHPRYSPMTGDLLFIRANPYDSDMEQAIKESTGKYTHVALLELEHNPKYPGGTAAWVIEATPSKGVVRTPWHDWRHSWDYDTYRLNIPFDTAAVIARAKSLLGKPYDNAFLPDNDAYYCSELIQTAFGDLFESKPMNWRDANGKLPDYWKKHFKELGIPVPEGVPGTNPTDLSHSPLLDRIQ